MKLKSVLHTLMIFGVVLVVSGVAAPAPSSAAIKIKVANQFNDTHLQTLANVRFKELLEKRSGGAFEVTIFNNNQLGTAEVWNDMLIRAIYT